MNGTEPAELPELALYCLPHAGGSAQPYTRLRTVLPPEVTVVPVELPGHGIRLREPPLRDLPELVAETIAIIEPRTAGLFAVFGHSFGSILGYEVTRELVRIGAPPAMLLASGRNGPSRPLPHRPFHSLPDKAFLAALARIGGIPDVLLAEEELLKAYLPAIRADLRVVEQYTPAAGPPLDLPVAAFAGYADGLTDPAGVAAWSEITSRTFDLTMVRGGHFFLEEPEFRWALASRIRRLLTTAAPAPAGA
jgi:medium-chain acyl-[acyl-carrier-protein] hydrolase